MIKNRTTQIIFQTVYCVLAIIGFFNSLGYFDAELNKDFYVYYTNLSNYICMFFMLYTLVKTASLSSKKIDGYVNVCPTFNFMCVIMIMVTFLVYNILLAGENTVVEYFTSQSNMIMHLILPIMFILHWVLFYEHNKLNWHQPLLCLVLPLIYVAFIVVRAELIGNDADTVLYPYFFLNVDNLGWGGFFAWIIVLLIVFVAIGYILFALDRIKSIKAKFKGEHHG